MKTMKKFLTVSLMCLVSAVSVVSCTVKAGNSKVMLTPGHRFKVIAGDYKGTEGSYEEVDGYYYGYDWANNKKFKIWKNSCGDIVYSYVGSIY